MAHQCLKCGRSYPDGSQEILRGCADCKGTRFFYTERPLEAGDREALAARTERELEGGPASEEQRPRGIPTKDELPVGSGREWVSIGPNHLRNIVEDVVKRAHERKPTFRVGGKETTKSLAEWVQEREAELGAVEEKEEDGPTRDVALDLAAPEARHPPWPEPRQAQRAASREKERAPSGPVDPEGVVYKRTRPLRPLGLAGEPVEAEDDATLRAAARRAEGNRPTRGPTPREGPAEDAAVEGGEDASLYPEGERPETVAVLEQGVYDLDVKRLLEKSPIVVHKDGTYSLHLPSLLESLGNRRR